MKEYCPAVRDQLTCGSCVAFGTLGIVETLMKKEYGVNVDLSERDLFSCIGTCDTGALIKSGAEAATLGVAVEKDVPYDSQNHACKSGRPKDWWKRGRAIKDWKLYSGVDEVKEALKTQPLIGFMTVHTSFFSYVGGVYHNLGDNDSVVGAHCIGIIEYDEAENVALCRNSWGSLWGESGYFRISLDELSTYAIGVTVCNNPLPEPEQTPDPRLGERIVELIKLIAGVGLKVLSALGQLVMFIVNKLLRRNGEWKWTLI
jgi:C1A family cysteine protease